MQTIRQVFTMPDGSDSEPVVTVREEGESLKDWRERANADLKAAMEAAYS